MNKKDSLERWEDIPKVNHKKKRRIDSITKELKENSKRIEYYKENIEGRTLRIIEKIYEKNKEKIKREEVLEPHRNLYNLICDVELLRLCHRKISINKGAMTPGSVNITADNINEEFLIKLSKELKEYKFKWSPSKRIYIEKPGKKKKRPLGLNDYRNKIVQEAIRMILEAIYEPMFEKLEANTGFRPKRDCICAIERIKKHAQFANIVIEGDISGAYDNVDHDILIGFLKRRIRDNKFLNIIHKGLKMGIMENLKFYDTNLGIPQGSICSPILFNIYMHEFDEYILNGDFKEIISDLNKEKSSGNRIVETREHRTIRARITSRRKKLEAIKDIDDISKVDILDIIQAIKDNNIDYNNENWNKLLEKGYAYARKRKADKNVNTNPEVLIFKNDLSSTLFDEDKEKIINNKRNKLIREIEISTQELKLTNYKDVDKTRIMYYYQRYADDWTLWIRSSTEIATTLKERIKIKLKESLKLDLSEEKTKITSIDEQRVNFLGFALYKNTNKRKKRVLLTNKKGSIVEFTKELSNIRVDVDRDRLDNRIKLNGLYRISKYYDRKDRVVPMEIPWLSVFEPHQIIEKFNQFMLGFGNYYITVINEPSRLGKYIYIYYYSCLKTLCQKYRISIRELINKHGYTDISEQENPHMYPKKTRKKMIVTDRRICFKYEFNNTHKWITLLNYKELMFKLLRYRRKYREKINSGQEFLTPQIDFLRLYKLNFRTKYKMNSYCIICGCTDQQLHNHHIKKLNHGGNKHYTGYKAFDKVVASLNRKQVTVCEDCHTKIHNGTYNHLSIKDLYDIRLATPESYIKNSNLDKDVNKGKSSEEIPYSVIDEKAKTYWNSDFSKYLIWKNNDSNKEE